MKVYIILIPYNEGGAEIEAVFATCDAATVYLTANGFLQDANQSAYCHSVWTKRVPNRNALSGFGWDSRELHEKEIKS